MAGKAKATQVGTGLEDRVAALAERLGLHVERKVRAARRITGKKRIIDVVVFDERSGKRLGIECKYQGTSGSAEEKIFATIEDIRHWPIPGLVVIDGEGFSKEIIGALLATGKVVWFEDLEDWLRLYFGLKK